MESVTLAQAIRNCIEIEEGARRFYSRLADSSKDEEVKSFFVDMAKQEKEHARWIGDMADQLEAGELPQNAHAKVKGIERAPGWEYVDDIQLSEAVQLALEAENSAALYYDAMSDMTEGQVKEFFLKLTRIEEQHATSLMKFQKERLG
jgi:rubrerythrin